MFGNRSLETCVAAAFLAALTPACASTPTPTADSARPVGEAHDARPSGDADPDATPPALRLPADVRPLAYALDLEVTPGAPRVAGTVTIDLELDRPRRIIWLHGEGLHVARATLADGRALAFAEVPDADGLARLALDPAAAPIAAGRTTVTLAFDAPVGQGGDGIFDVEGDGRHYTLTTFEPISARAAWPCFDEPGFKVPWTLTLSIPRGMVALSSAPMADETPLDDERTRVRFAPTRPLPSYLVSFAVGPFDVVSAPSLPPVPGRPEPLPIRGVALHGRGPALAHQLAEVGPIVASLERWFGRPYPYAKLDVVATPGYPGAMENAALVLFDELALMVDPSRAAREQVEDAANVLAHELSHQWFGDLVTMGWWDDLWLNEAFATWMANRTVAEVRPDLMAESHRLREWRTAMAADARASARKIRQPIANKHDMIAAFDAITYQKGASLIAMFSSWVGPDAWQAGVRDYLAEHAYGSATTDDLLAAVARHTDRPIAAPFKSFLDATGAPLVTVAVGTPEAGALPVTFHVERMRPVGSQADPGGAWQVPVCLGGPGLDPARACTLVSAGDAAGTQASLPFSGKAVTAVAPNAGGVGYYQAVVEPEALLRAALVGRSPAEAATAVASYAAAFESGRLSAGDVLTALAPLAASPEPELALAPMRVFAWAVDHAARPGDAPVVAKKGRALYGKQLARLGWSERPGKDDGKTALLRAKVIDFMVTVARDPATRKAAAARGKAFLGDGKTLDPRAVATDLTPTALGVWIEDGGAPAFDAALTALRAATDPALRDLLLGGLARATTPAEVDRALALTLDPALTDIEMTTPIRRLLDRRETRAVAWRYFVEHFDAIVARFPPFALGFLPEFATGFCSEEERRVVAAFFEPKLAGLPGAPQTLASTLESIGLCAALTARQGDSARVWLTSPR